MVGVLAPYAGARARSRKAKRKSRKAIHAGQRANEAKGSSGSGGGGGGGGLRRTRPSRGALPRAGSEGLMKVAIVGRPNVGKSSLFNRLVGRSLALVDALPGVTRDRREAMASLGGMAFAVVDTAGLDEPVRKSIAREARGKAAEAAAMEAVMADKGVLRAMMEQTREALRDATVVAFMVDVRAGISPYDEYFARWLHKAIHETRAAGAPAPATVLLANKCDGAIADELMFSDELDNGWSLDAALRLGFGEPVYLSAEDGDGLAGLYNALSPHAPDAAAEDGGSGGGAAEGEGSGPAAPRERAMVKADGREERRARRHGEAGIRVAVVGRPNVGKSTLANILLGGERFVVGDMPGVTQDANEVTVDWAVPDELRGGVLESLGEDDPETVPVTLVDTAGMLKPSAAAKASYPTPKRLAGMAYRAALSAIGKAHVVVLVTDIKPSVRGDGFHNPTDPTRTAKKNAKSEAVRKAKTQKVATEVAAEITALGLEDVVDVDEAIESAVFDQHGFEFDPEQTVFSSMDAQIVRRVSEEGRGLVVAVNKWDLLGRYGEPVGPGNPDSRLGDIVKHLETKLQYVTPPALRDSPWVPVAAGVGNPDGVRSGLIPKVFAVYDGWNMRVPTGPLNDWLQDLALHRSPPGKIRYITQVDSRPPKFVVFAAKRGSPSVWSGWLRFVANEMRQTFGLYGVPIRMNVQQG